MPGMNMGYTKTGKMPGWERSAKAASGWDWPQATDVLLLIGLAPLPERHEPSALAAGHGLDVRLLA